MPFLGKNCPLFSNCVLVLKCPFWCAIRMVADSSIFYSILTWPNKKLPFPCLSPKYFWKVYWFAKSKSLRITALRKKEGAGTTPSHKTQIRMSWKYM